MAASLVGGAALGAVFGELLNAVLKMKDKATMFKHTLAYLGTTLTAIDPMMKEIEQQNDNLGRRKEELESLIKDMEEGTKLVLKCSKISRLNFLARNRYQEQMAKLVDSLVRFFIIDMQVQNARDLKDTLCRVIRIQSVVNKLSAGSASDSAIVPVDDDVDDSAAIEDVTVESGVNESKSMQPAQKAEGADFAEQFLHDITSLSDQVSQFLVKVGDLCEEELLTRTLDPEYSSNIPISTRAVETISKVESLACMADNLKLVASKFGALRRFLHKQRLKATFRFYSMQWRVWATCYIQAAWRRYQKKKLERPLRELEDMLQDDFANE